MDSADLLLHSCVLIYIHRLLTPQTQTKTFVNKFLEFCIISKELARFSELARTRPTLWVTLCTLAMEFQCFIAAKFGAGREEVRYQGCAKTGNS